MAVIVKYQICRIVQRSAEAHVEAWLTALAKANNPKTHLTTGIKIPKIATGSFVQKNIVVDRWRIILPSGYLVIHHLVIIVFPLACLACGRESRTGAAETKV